MRKDLAANAVLERGDDFAARGVILGVCREAELHVEGEPHRIAFDLDVALLHHVEQSDLYLTGQIGELVQREETAVGPRQHAIVDRELVGKQVSTARRLDWIEVTDQVRDRDVRRGELLDVSIISTNPRDRRVVAGLSQEIARELRDWRERVVVDLAPRDDRNLFVEECRERAENARLRLTSEPEQNEVVTRQNRVHDLWHHRLLVTDHTGE